MLIYIVKSFWITYYSWSLKYNIVYYSSINDKKKLKIGISNGKYFVISYWIIFQQEKILLLTKKAYQNDAIHIILTYTSYDIT